MNDYIIGYDKGIKKDRSSLIISKYNNSNLYVLTEFYDEKADLLNEIITTLQQKNIQLKSILTDLEEWLKSRAERVPETMAEVYEDKVVLDKIAEFMMKEKYK